jgi:hypothetical protein
LQTKLVKCANKEHVSMLFTFISSSWSPIMLLACSVPQCLLACIDHLGGWPLPEGPFNYLCKFKDDAICDLTDNTYVIAIKDDD